MATMTEREQTALDRAIERATSHNIVVVAQGTFKETGDKFWLTTSSPGSQASYHVVQLVWRQHLECDCLSAQHRGSEFICSHRAATHMFLVNQAARKQRQSDAIEAALEAEQQAREQAVLQRSNDGISIFKQQKCVRRSASSGWPVATVAIGQRSVSYTR